MSSNHVRTIGGVETLVLYSTNGTEFLFTPKPGYGFWRCLADAVRWMDLHLHGPRGMVINQNSFDAIKAEIMAKANIPVNGFVKVGSASARPSRPNTAKAGTLVVTSTDRKAHTGGCICRKCRMKNDYATPNQSDGTYVCYECR